MNSLYIGIGVAIIVALVTALVGPYFVDWTAYRSVFEREGQRIFGENVTVLGRAQVRLLPMPSISLSDVIIGPVDHPDLKIDRLDLKIETTPLLKGEIRISELRLDRPVLRMGIGADGAPVLPGMYASMKNAGGGPDVGAIGLEFAEIVDGRVLLFDERSGAEATIEGLNGTASAAALSGPMKLDGGASLEGHAFTFRFATGKRGEDGRWPMRLQANPMEGPYQVSLDSTLDTAGATPKATGTLTLQRLAVGDGKGDKFGAQPMPWQLDSHFAADAKAVVLDGAQLAVGEAESAYAITGNGRLDLGTVPKFDVDLAAKQIDIDRLIAQKVDEPTDPQVASARIEDMVLGLPKLPLAGRIHLGLGGVVLGGGALQDIDLDIRTRSDGWAVDNFAAKLPGRSRIAAKGRLVIPLTPSTSPTFAGDMTIASDQPTALLQWWTKGPSPAIDPFDFAGRVALAVGSFRVDELQARIGAANAKGALAWTAATPIQGAHLKATLSADKLDLDQAKVIGGLIAAGLGQTGAVGDTAAAKSTTLPTLDLDLDAGVVLVAGEPLKGVAARAVFDGSTLTIDKLTIRDAIGAAIDVKGRIDKLTTTPDGAIDGSIRAERLAGLVRLIDRLNPGQAWVKTLVAAAPALGPINAKARLTGDAGAAASNVHLTLDGSAAASRLSLAATFAGRLDQFRGGALDASLQLEGPDGGLVLRQIGLSASSDSVSAGKLLVSVKGIPAMGLAVTANADIGGSKLTSTGHARTDDAGSIAYDAEAKVTSADLRLPATMFGQAIPSGGAAVPVDLHARIDGNGLKAKLSSLGGRLAGGGIVGGADLDFGQWPVRIDGALQFTQADMETLLELGLGADAFEAPISKGSAWPSDVLSGPKFATLNANIDVKADRLTIDATRGIDRFATKLRVRPGQLLFDNVVGTFASGDLTGALGLKLGTSGEIGLTGNLQLKGGRLADVVWRRDDRAVADGRMDLTATFDSTGRSIAALSAALNGNGAFTVTDGLMRYVDPDAFGAIIAAADGGLELKEDKIRTVFQGRLDAGTLPFQRIEAAFSIGSGVLRVNTINVVSERAQTNGSVSLDFGRWSMDADWTLKVDPGKNGVVGAEPQVGVLFRGPIDAPKRSLDVAPLSAFLTLRAFEREVQRVEDMQADIMEQQRFQRELKRLKDEHARRDQERQAAEAAAKQKAIDDAKKAEEARKAAAAQAIEDARKAAEAQKADIARKAAAAEEARRAAAAQKAAEAQAAEDARKAAEAQKAEEVGKAAEAKRAADVQGAEDARKAADAQADAEAQKVLSPPPSIVPSPPDAATPAPSPTLAPSVAPEVTPPASDLAPAPAPTETSGKPVEPVPLAAPPVASPPVQLGAPTTTQALRKRAVPPSALPDLPPIIFISPRPPIMPLTVPTSPVQ